MIKKYLPMLRSFFVRNLIIKIIDHPEKGGAEIQILIPKNKDIVRDGAKVGSINDGYILQSLINALLGFAGEAQAKHAPFREQGDQLFDVCNEIQQVLMNMLVKYKEQSQKKDVPDVEPKVEPSPIIVP